MLAVKEKQEVGRPLKVLVPLIKEELEAGNEAGLAHYRRAGEMLLEAKEQVEFGEWHAWIERNFHLSVRSAQVYMRLARGSQDEPKNAASSAFRTLSEAEGDRRPTHEPAWSKPVKREMETVDAKEIKARLEVDTKRRMNEAKLARELGLKMIDIGYKVLATKLHPDKGGSKEAMERLNYVRDRLKKALPMA